MTLKPRLGRQTNVGEYFKRDFADVLIDEIGYLNNHVLVIIPAFSI